ncbi:hypothetical protein ERX27_10685 [Macrococcus brunensis]|uniref:Bifunctional autolysin n=1 Tax=Macrococcus brunensis TaxID=198483 RepID=A0A4R6BAT7_9STAP|nr:N-acetylmuramoyl-L-alanine amidase [Macrococcus brunensis]TDL93386.1 hypothetical protein ERX27_10685 [Macrococcus brunensis]
MNSKFFYKSSPLLLMMLAAHSTAQAAENQVSTETEKNDNTDQNASTSEQTQTYDVKQTIDASATPYNFETTEIPVKDTTVSTEEPKAEVQSTEVQTEVSSIEAPAQDTTASTEEPKTEAASTEVKTEVSTTEAPAQNLTVSTKEPKTEAASKEVQNEEATTEVPVQNTTTTAEEPETEVQSTEVQTEVPVTEAPAQDTTVSTEEPKTEVQSTEVKTEATSIEEPIEKTTSTTTQVTKTETPVDNTATSEPVKAAEAQPVTAQSVTTTQSEKSTAPTQTLTAQTSSSLLTQKRAVTLQRTAPKTLTLSMSPTTQTRTLAASTSAINSFILSQNYTVPTYKQDFAPDLPKMPYRNGVARPEGVVAHETANPTSTIYGEVAYMKNNWNNAFVHAYVDDNEVIETANTDYLAWGAGPAGNARFIHVELVRVYGKERFAKAINNYADYIATNLHYYDLPVDSAEYDGTGTLWSHKAVSNFLGGTDHADPYGWFQENGYSMDELAELVTLKYNQKVSSLIDGPVVTPPTTVTPPPVVIDQPVAMTPPVVSSTSKMAKIKTTSSPVYASVTDQVAVPAAQKSGLTFYANKKAIYNNKTYYALSDELGTPRGWVESGELIQANRGAEKVTSSKFTINNMIRGIYTVPWGTAAQKVASLSDSINSQFAPSKYVYINSVPYYYGTINNHSGWINGNHLTLLNGLTNIKSVNMMGRTIRTGSTIYTNTNLSSKLPSKIVDKQYYINKQALKGTTKYYQLVDSANKFVGWTDENQLYLRTHQNISTNPAPFAVNMPTAHVYSIPYGGVSQRIKALTNDNQSLFNVTKAEKVGTAIWYKGTLTTSNTTGWVLGKYLTKQSNVFSSMKPVDMMGRTTREGTVIYSDNNLKSPLAVKDIDKQYYLKVLATKGTDQYYQLSDVNNKVIGWAKSTDLYLRNHQTVNWNKTTLYVNKPEAHIYSIPYGGKSQRILPLTKYYNSPFYVVKAEKVGDKVWYKGTLSTTNTIGWILGKYLSSHSVTTVTSPVSLQTALTRQMSLSGSSAPKVVYADSYGRTAVRNATKAEVLAAMTTDTIKNGGVQQYQFLNLNKSQGIAATTLNKLLVNKGILANQGAAFAEASKLYNINEIYLISHALWETGNGTSQLSNGMGYNTSTGQATTYGTKYYNMYGTRAVDNNALNSGIQYAYQQGWNTPAKAIIGGAQYVAQNYFGNKQFTLYEMRWNPANPATHQYATDIKWASKNAMRIADFYRRIELTGLKYLIDQYK